VAKVGTSNPDGTISLKRLQCVVENKINKFRATYFVQIALILPQNVVLGYPQAAD
jgi:hypothetical protein